MERRLDLLRPHLDLDLFLPLDAERRLLLLRPPLDLDLFLPLDAERRRDLLRPHLDLDLFLPLDAERRRLLLRPHLDLDRLEERRLDRLLDFPHFLLLDRLRDFFFPPRLLPALDLDLDLPFERERPRRFPQALLVSFSSSSTIALRGIFFVSFFFFFATKNK